MIDRKPVIASLGDLVAWLTIARGALVPAADMLEILRPIASASAPSTTAREAAAPVETWRERLWRVPADTRLGVTEAAEALGKPKSWVYRHTSARTGLPQLPHKKLGGDLTFVAGELRTWLADHEETIVAGRVVPTLPLKRTA